jgi:DNA-binding transcriptional ArsR family regulator
MRAFAALADPTRARIVDALAARERTVNEIVELFPISQPSISRHLRILREAGLVSVEASGRLRRYRLDPRPLREIDAWLARYRALWAGRLDALEAHMDAEEES